MKHVAALAGVSLSTVSRVVNGDPAVRADLAERVRRAVEVLEYRHNAAASALRRADGLSASIGLIVARERLLAEAFAARGVDGLIVAPTAADHSFLLRDRTAGMALVFVDRPGRLIDADAALTDNFGGAAQAAEHLGYGPPTAIFTSQNLITIEAARALHDLGMERSIALVGFDESCSATS